MQNSQQNQSHKASNCLNCSPGDVQKIETQLQQNVKMSEEEKRRRWGRQEKYIIIAQRHKSSHRIDERRSRTRGCWSVHNEEEDIEEIELRSCLGRGWRHAPRMMGNVSSVSGTVKAPHRWPCANMHRQVFPQERRCTQTTGTVPDHDGSSHH